MLEVLDPINSISKSLESQSVYLVEAIEKLDSLRNGIIALDLNYIMKKKLYFFAVIISLQNYRKEAELFVGKNRVEMLNYFNVYFPAAELLVHHNTKRQQKIICYFVFICIDL